jgi:predicted esterase
MKKALRIPPVNLCCCMILAAVAVMPRGARAQEAAARPDLENLQRSLQELKTRADAIPAGQSRAEFPANPAPGQRAPLLVFLHGMGSTPDNAMRMLHPLVEALSCAVLAPCGSVKVGTPERYGYNWQWPRDGKQVLDEVRRLVDGGRVDAKAVYLMGFSAGGSLTYALSLAHPDRFAGAMVFSGALQPQLAKPRTIANAAGRLPVYIVHGTSDAVMSHALATEARDRLSSGGVRVQLRSFDGAHQLPPDFVGTVREALAWFRQEAAAPPPPPTARVAPE